MVIVPLASVLCAHWWGFGPVSCVGFLMGGTGACVLVGRAESFPSDEQGHVRWCVLGVCELSITLGNLCANGWVCVPVFFVVWCPGGVQRWELLAVGWSRVLDSDRGLHESSWRLIFPGDRNSLVVQHPGLGAPLQSLRPDFWSRDQDPASCASQQ